MRLAAIDPSVNRSHSCFVTRPFNRHPTCRPLIKAQVSQVNYESTHPQASAKFVPFKIEKVRSSAARATAFEIMAAR